MSLNERLHDRETQTGSAYVLQIGFSFVEDFFQKLFRDSLAIVGDPALNTRLRSKVLRSDDNLSARCVLDRVANLVLHDSS